MLTVFSTGWVLLEELSQQQGFCPGQRPDDAEKEELEATLTEKLTNSENPEETEKAIQAIGSIINAQFVIVNGQVILVTPEAPQE